MYQSKGAMGHKPPSENTNTSNFGEIYTIYVNLPEKNFRNNPNSLGAPLRELQGAEPPLENSYTSDFGEI